MSLIPVFEIGVWNAWIFTIWLLIVLFLGPLNIIPKGREEGSDFTAEFSKTQKYVRHSMHIIYLLSIIYSIFVPLRLGTVWFYAGLPVYLLGLVSYAMVWVGFATTPPDKPVTRGVYRYSRNPMYLSTIILGNYPLKASNATKLCFITGRYILPYIRRLLSGSE